MPWPRAACRRSSSRKPPPRSPASTTPGTASSGNAVCEPPAYERPTVSLVIREHPSPNHDERLPGEPVDVLVLHYTGMKTAKEAIERLCDEAAAVSSHYVVDEDGAVLRLVPEDRRAWHAGVSYWRGHTALNGRSIGIEIVNPGHEWGYRDFPVLQMAAVCDLCLSILSRPPIPARNVVAHSDVAPDRKEDPGEKFGWEDLARNGVGLWPMRVPDRGT